MTACLNPGHAGAPQDGCTGCARDCEAELTRTRDQLQRMTNTQSDGRRRTYAAARRTAWDHVHGTIGRFYWGGIPDEMMPEVRPVLYRATQVNPDAARRAADRSLLDQLRQYAGTALAAWDQRVAQVVAECAADPRETEITRLRDLITATGQRLHAGHGTQFDGFNPCPCAGCRLILDMDTAGLPEPAGEPA